MHTPAEMLEAHALRDLEVHSDASLQAMSQAYKRYTNAVCIGYPHKIKNPYNSRVMKALPSQV